MWRPPLPCPANWKATCIFDRKDLILTFKTRPVWPKIYSQKHVRKFIWEKTGHKLSGLLIHLTSAKCPDLDWSIKINSKVSFKKLKYKFYLDDTKECTCQSRKSTCPVNWKASCKMTVKIWAWSWKPGQLVKDTTSRNGSNVEEILCDNHLVNLENCI